MRASARPILTIVACWIVPIAAHAVPSCTVSVSGLSFGIISMGNLADVDSTATVEIACNNPNTAYSVALSTGAGTYAQRTMLSNGQPLHYNIFTSPTYTSVWGDGTGGSLIVSGLTPSNANGANNKGIQTLYGRIPLTAIGAAYSGSYTDAIVVTISY